MPVQDIDSKDGNRPVSSLGTSLINIRMSPHMYSVDAVHNISMRAALHVSKGEHEGVQFSAKR